MRPYEKNPSAIYAQSFATVRAEARLDRFDAGMQALAIRLIHSCGMVEIADRIVFSDGAYQAGQAALASGAPVLCDCEMAGAGIIRRYLPADNQVVVTLNDPSVPDHAQSIGNTRSAAAVDLWLPHLEGAVVAIGNAPTALFHLLELLDQGAPKPAVILGFPVGLSGLPSPRRNFLLIPVAVISSLCVDVAVVRRLHLRLSMRWLLACRRKNHDARASASVVHRMGVSCE